MAARRPTPSLSRLTRATRRFVRAGLFARLALGALLLLASPSTAGIVEDALDLAGFSCCEDESTDELGRDCCPGGESHCAGCVHPAAIVPEALLALGEPYAFDVDYTVPSIRAPTASHRAPPFRPPNA